MKYIKSSNEWILSNSEYRQAKLLITKKWVYDNMIMFKNNKTEEDLKIEAMKAPSLIELKENEKFVNIDGNKLDIEVRGTRDVNNIYFKVKDVADKFGLGDVTTMITNNDSSFMIDTHYKLFKIQKSGVPGYKTIKKSQKLLFLTFKGLTKLLFVSRSKNAEHFQDWATNLLFTVQLGTKESKSKLANDLLGCDAKVANEVINKGVNVISSIYLFTLGYVKNLRSSLNIDSKFNDDEIVCKFGRTNDLSRRTGEHLITFNKIENVELKLKCYSYIDNQYTSNAEADINNYFKTLNMNLKYENMEELVVIKKEYLKIIEDLYQNIGRKYMGNNSELITQLKQRDYENRELKDTIEKNELKFKLELQELKYTNEATKKDCENQLLRKELELMKYYISSK